MPALSLIRPALFDALPGVTAAFSRRAGGVSPAPYDALNLGLSTDDDPARVRENRRRLFEALGFRPEDAALAGQVHGRDVRVVDAGGLYRGFDGLVTTTPGVALAITAADCAAVLLADAEARVVGACHSGWRGTVARIAEHTVATMAVHGARPERMRAYVGPCISAAHFEVGPEVAAQFDDAFVVTRPDWPRPHVDLKAAIAAQLVGCGLPPAQIEVSDACTVADADRFFSYRAHHGRTGRMMGVIGMRDG